MSELWAERYEAVGDLFRVLSSPVRVALVDLLAEQPLFVHQIVATSGLAQPHVSQQLRILRDAGLVRRVRQGRKVYYALRDEHVAHIVADAIAHAVEAHAIETHAVEAHAVVSEAPANKAQPVAAQAIEARAPEITGTYPSVPYTT
jgi:DNA-binding transcriptional ArsR family regulator